MTNSESIPSLTFSPDVAYRQPMCPGPIAPREQDIIYSISIRQVDSGYFVEVGCKTFAIETSTKLIALLSAYILQPAETQKLYEQGKLF